MNNVTDLVDNICVLMVGVGPNAKRTYIPFFRKNNIKLGAVVDLKSERTNVGNTLIDFPECEIYCIPDELRDSRSFPDNVVKKIDNIILTKKITHIIINCEPKGHFAYLMLFSKYKVNILVEKPIIATEKMFTTEDVKLMRNSYYQVMESVKNGPVEQCQVMCQRRMNPGYEIIMGLLEDVISGYNIPITGVTIEHCDGNWMMPHDLEYENHPYKYGYGKLYHSGYHFVDLMCQFLNLNELASQEKHLETIKMYNSILTPVDESYIITEQDIRNIFRDQNIPSYYFSKHDLSHMGEKSVVTQLECKNSTGQNITLASLNISQLGFSRRGWVNTHQDHYKNNGRIRHELVKVQVGPLMSIQVHSYQSKQVCDRTSEESGCGGLDHFDIDIFRNCDIIGGKPFEQISYNTLKQLSGNKITGGINEYSREQFLLNYFSKNPKIVSDISYHKLGIEVMYYQSLAIINYRNGNNKDFIFMINELKNHFNK